MVMKRRFRLTKEGVAELEAELKNAIADRRVIAGNIKTAREFGDLSENAEYQSARQAQEKNDARIAELENILQNVQLIGVAKGSNDKVVLGSHVKLQSTKGKIKEFQVVGTVEADPLNGKISDESPIGQALLDKKKGEAVEIKTPAETAAYKIIEIK
jgi:transcription elongation factor GreA